MSSHMAVEVCEVSKIYGSEKQGLSKSIDNVGFSVGQGRILGLIGLHRAGKTSIVKMMCGLTTPSSGKIYLNGHDVFRHHSAAMRQIGVVLDGTHSLHPRFSIWENLIYFGKLKGSRGTRLEERAKMLMEEFDLRDHDNLPVRYYSRGIQQKVSIACAAVADPPILILDEPLQDLDVKSKSLVKKWIVKSAKEQGKTIVVATEQIPVAQQICDRAAVISQGRLVVSASIQECLRIFGRTSYEIRVGGQVDLSSEALLDQMSIAEENDETVIRGRLLRQDTEEDLQTKIEALNVTILSFDRLESSLEEAVLRIIGKK